MIQEPNAIIDPSERVTDTAVRAALEARAMGALQAVLDNGAKIELDHHLVYYTRTSCLSSPSFPHPSTSLHLSPFHLHSILYTKNNLDR